MKNKVSSICIVIILCAFFKPVLAQSNEVCGFVKHYFDGNPVEEVRIYIENSVAITIADKAGAFCLNLTKKENKIWFEKDGYFKTYISAKAGDFLSIDMIRNTEQDLLVAKGLSIINIEALNVAKESHAGSAKPIFVDGFTTKASPTMSLSSRSSKTTMGGALGAPGADGAPIPPAAMKVRGHSTDALGASSRSAEISSSRKMPAAVSMSVADIDEGTSSKIKALEKKRVVDHALESIVPYDIVLEETLEDVVPETKTLKEIKAGRLTAGEIDDFSKWELWNDLSDNELSKYKDIWEVYPKERYVIQAVTEQGFPVVDATVNLTIDGETTWTAKTDNTGKAELWNLLFESQPASKKTEQANLAASINYRNIENSVPQLKRFEEGLNVVTFKQDCDYAKNVDIAFVVDATGSMGDEIDYLKVELLDVIDKIQNQFEALTIRLGNVFYRDKTDAYLTKNSPLTQNINAGVAFIKDQRAGGGGDFPEAVDVGLEEAVSQLSWSNNAVARILFLVLDAPPHQNEAVNKRIQQTIHQAAQKGIRIVPIVGSGIDKSTEYLLRSCALATNGHYVFLTDHSGIGGSHLKPSTDSYEVKNLNDLLVDIVTRYVQVQDCDGKDKPDIVEPSTDTKISILPNPNDGRFLIKTPTDLKELFITDVNGKILVRFTDFATGENQVDIANFPTGTYYVRYQIEGKISSEKVIIKR